MASRATLRVSYFSLDASMSFSTASLSACNVWIDARSPARGYETREQAQREHRGTRERDDELTVKR